MKNRILWLSILAWGISLLSTSCTHKPYHPTKGEREWAIDHEACERWAREGIRDEPDTYDHMDEMKMIRECMKKEGWKWERTSLFDFKKESEE